MNLEKVSIIGAGSVGSFLKQRLQSASILKIHTRAETHFAIEPDSIVFITPKLVDLKACIVQMGELPSHCVLVFIQNGLGICEEFLPRNWVQRNDITVVRALLWLGARLDRETGILYTTDVESIEMAGEGAAAQASVERVRALLEMASLPVKVGGSISEVEWKKAYWNVSLNALAALARVMNQEVLERPELRTKFDRLLEEAAAVARARGIVLTEVDRQRVIAATRKVGSNRNSMLQDLEAGRATELPWLNERLIHWGQENGVSTVNHEEIVREIHLSESFCHH